MQIASLEYSTNEILSEYIAKGMFLEDAVSTILFKYSAKGMVSEYFAKGSH